MPRCNCCFALRTVQKNLASKDKTLQQRHELFTLYASRCPLSKHGLSPADLGQNGSEKLLSCCCFTISVAFRLHSTAMRRLSVLVLLALVTAPASADVFGSISNAINSATDTVSNGLNTATNAVSSGVGTAVNATSNGLDVAANATKQVGCSLSTLP